MGTAYEKGIGSVVTGSGVTLERSPRVEITDAEKMYLSGVTPGTIEAGKAVVADSSGNISSVKDATFEDIDITDEQGTPSLDLKRTNADTVLADNADQGLIRWYGHDGTQLIQGADLFARVDGTPTTDEMPTEVVIGTSPGAGGVVARVRVSPAGHVEPMNDSAVNAGSATKKFLKVFSDAYALGATDITATGAEINKLDDSVEDVYADGIGLARIAKATYDFAVDGGAISAIDLGTTIPANSIIMGGLVDVQTTCTSSSDTGTGALSVEGANDIVAAVAIGTGTPWDQGLQAIIPAMTAGTAVKTTAAANITFTIAVEAFTAGKFTVILYYIPTIVNT